MTRGTAATSSRALCSLASVGVFVGLTASPSVACCPGTPPDEFRPAGTDLEGLGCRNWTRERGELQVCCRWCLPIEHICSMGEAFNAPLLLLTCLLCVCRCNAISG